MKDITQLLKAVTFAILMENNEGILGKAPSYVIEKFIVCMDLPNPETLLDIDNKHKLQKYLKIWGLLNESSC